MDYPMLQSLPTETACLLRFGGYDRREGLGEKAFYDMQNLTSDHYPQLATRACRSLALEGGVTGLISKDGLCTVRDGEFCINGYPTGLQLSTDGADNPKTLVAMGAYVIILPDRMYINTADPTDRGSLDVWYFTEQTLVARLCDGFGEVYSLHSGQTAPEDTACIWVDTTTSPPTARQYGGDSGWQALPEVYVRLDCPGIGAGFDRYDGVELSGFTDVHLKALNGSAVIWERGEDFIVVAGVLPGRVEETATVTVSRVMPQLDHLVEYQNRLWGCFYGLRDGKPVNEIYASKQGDFKNWSCFMGLETDSYRVSCGTDGPFTGAAVVQNNPVFFKEDCMHLVYGDAMPFRVQTLRCRGVEQGSAASLAVVDEIAYYKSREGICAYDGSLPRLVSQALGHTVYRNGVGGGHRGKYYISLCHADGRSLFVYDTRLGLWHREDDLALTRLCESGGRLYGLLADGSVVDLHGGQSSYESAVDFMAETGYLGLIYPESKYLHSLLLRLRLDGHLAVQLSCDDGPWQTVYDLQTNGMRSCSLPIHPRRCDRFRLRLQGRGALRLAGVQSTLERGGDRP